MGNQASKLCDFSNIPNAQFIANPLTSPQKQDESFEVIPRLLNLVAKEQFGGSASEDASMHLHDFCEIYDMQIFKNVENDIVKLKLFPFSVRGKSKDWLFSLPNGSINSWENLREAFIKMYYPPVKILQNRNSILYFKQNDNEHVAIDLERLKFMLRTCPSHVVVCSVQVSEARIDSGKARSKIWSSLQVTLWITKTAPNQRLSSMACAYKTICSNIFQHKKLNKMQEPTGDMSQT
jgi:hypothetical protein